MNRNINKAIYVRKEDRKPNWIVLDASGKVLGRLASQVAILLRGKHKPDFTPHTDTGDYVVIINADKVVMTGDKKKQKEYPFYSGYIGGLKIKTAEELMEKHPDWIIKLAVKRMLPPSKLGRAVLKKLKIYTGSDHPHQAQISQP